MRRRVSSGPTLFVYSIFVSFQPKVHTLNFRLAFEKKSVQG